MRREIQWKEIFKEYGLRIRVRVNHLEEDSGRNKKILKKSFQMRIDGNIWKRMNAKRK